MRRAADARRAQAAVEWIALMGAVGAALAVGALAADDVAGGVAARLAPAESGPDARLLAASAHGDPRAPGLLGAEAWLAESLGAATARERVADAVRRELRDAHPAWGVDLRIDGVAIRGRRPRTVIRASGPTAVRIVSEDEERRASQGGPTPLARARAGASPLLWAGAQALARRIARPLGIAVAAVQLALGLEAGHAALAPGLRAGDAIACRRAQAVVTGGARPGKRSVTGLWRVGILRDGRLIADAVRAGDDPCRAPADG